MTAREGSVLNPRFPAPVNTYNPTIHALVDAIFDALSHIVPGKVRADGSGSRSIIIGGRTTYTGKGYVQYEIIAGGAGARASQGRRVRHHGQPEQRQDRADRDHRERVPDARHALRADPGFRRRRRVPRRAGHPARISQSRGCALLDPLDEAHDPAATAAPAAAPAAPATSGSIPTAEAPSACRRAMPTIRSRRATCSGSIRRAAAATAIRSRAIPSACSPTCARACLGRSGRARLRRRA